MVVTGFLVYVLDDRKNAGISGYGPITDRGGQYIRRVPPSGGFPDTGRVVSPVCKLSRILPSKGEGLPQDTMKRTSSKLVKKCLHIRFY